MSALRRSCDDEDGAVAVIAGVSLLTLLLMASYVIDLGFLRADRVASQSVADMAAAAAVVDLDLAAPNSAEAACRDALEFARANLAVDHGDTYTLSPVAGASCAAAFNGITCDPTVPRTAWYRGGPFTIEVVHPIPASPDGTGTYDRFMSGQASDANHDGVPCERFGVSVEHERARYIFGGERTTTRNAVARRFLDGEDGDYASLVVLLRDGCPSLTASGGSFVNVMNLTREEPDEDGIGTVEVTYPGNITVDTLPPSGPCGGNPIIGVSGSGTKILASGRLVAHALQSADPGNASGKTHSDTPPSRLTPPEPGPRITRSPVDHEYNCIADAYPSGQTWSPQRDGQAINGCTSATASDHIRKLRTDLSAVTATSAGWQRFPDATRFPGHSCSNSGATGAITPAAAGSTKLFVDCAVGGSSMVNGTGRMRFEGFSHIIFKEGIRLSSGGRFEIRGPTDTGTVAYLKSGRLEQSGGKMLLENTFVYLDGPSNVTNGANAEYLGITGSMETYAHKAPLDRTNCPSSGTPNGSCFTPLALWSNALAEHSILGGGGLGVIGTVFTPNAVMKLRTGEASGGDECSATPSFSDLESLPSGGMNMDAAQFFSEAIDISGGGELRMCPNPETTIQVPLWGNGLIR